MKLDHFLIRKNKFKMGERPNCEIGNHQKTIKSAGSNLLDLSPSNFLLDTSSEAMEAKAKMNYWGLFRIKSFCKAKETIKVNGSL